MFKTWLTSELGTAFMAEINVIAKHIESGVNQTEIVMEEHSNVVSAAMFKAAYMFAAHIGGALRSRELAAETIAEGMNTRQLLALGLVVEAAIHIDTLVPLLVAMQHKVLVDCAARYMKSEPEPALDPTKN